jgi:hypothetical protein
LWTSGRACISRIPDGFSKTRVIAGGGHNFTVHLATRVALQVHGEGHGVLVDRGESRTTPRPSQQLPGLRPCLFNCFKSQTLRNEKTMVNGWVWF